MAVVRWHPMRDLTRMHDDMDRLFGSLLTERPTNPFWTDSPKVPALDVRTEDGKYIVHLDVPGIKKENVDIQVTDEAVTVKAEYGGEEEEEKNGYLHRERYRGTVQRSFRLPSPVSAGEATAKLEDGTLILTLPIRETPPGSRRLTVE